MPTPGDRAELETRLGPHTWIPESEARNKFEAMSPGTVTRRQLEPP